MAEKGMFETAGDFIGGAWDNMSILDRIALGVSPVPIVGDIIGGVADAVNIGGQISETGEVPWTDVGLALTGLLPFVPPAAAARGIRGGLASMSEKALKNTPNYLQGFYSAEPLGKVFGIGTGSVESMANQMKMAYSPKAQALYKQYGMTNMDTRLMKETVEKAEGTYKPTLATKARLATYKKLAPKLDKLFKKDGSLTKMADDIVKEESDLSKVGKKAVGQINYSRLLSDQYNNRESLYKVLDGVDQAAFGDFSPKVYDKLMGVATNLKKSDTDALFKEIADIQGMPDGMKYRMAIRRNTTGQAGGNLNRIATSQKVFGGSSMKGLQKVFRDVNGKNKTFKGKPRELIAALDAQGIGIHNRAKALEGGPIILTGSAKSDAFELGGVNIMTVVKPDGNIVSVVNDVNDLIGFPATKLTPKIEINAPFADRLINIGQPQHYNLLDNVGRPPKVQAAMDTLRQQSQDAKGFATHTKDKVLPGTGMNTAQSEVVKTVANLEPSAQALRRGTAQVAGNVGLFATRAGKPIERSTRQPDEEIQY